MAIPAEYDGEKETNNKVNDWTALHSQGAQIKWILTNHSPLHECPVALSGSLFLSEVAPHSAPPAEKSIDRMKY